MNEDKVMNGDKIVNLTIEPAEMLYFFKRRTPQPKEAFDSEMHEFMKHKQFNWEAKKDKPHDDDK